MSHVLARKYRPRNFEEVVGQEITVRVLQNALSDNQKRLHHAYLFSGPRGIGKTSLARIFAKALNCEKNPTPSPTPCGECHSCRDITEGRSLSVSEIDGASHTSVDDVRDLRDKIRYLPPGGRYRIYIIDEVHMLSTAAFNALLKTLEEPPAHALFIFATTDPQKVPATVLSRVLRFDLRPMTPQLIVGQLKKILEAESLKAEDNALFQIAREAQGGMRDALGLLDQVLSFSGHHTITLTTVEEILGVSTRSFVLAILESILAGEGAATLRQIEASQSVGIDPRRLSIDLLEYFRHLLVVKVTQDPSLVGVAQQDVEELIKKSEGISPAELDRIFRILQKGVAELLRSSMPQILLDVLLLRLCRYKDLRPLEEILKMMGQSGGGSPIRSAPVMASEVKPSQSRDSRESVTPQLSGPGSRNDMESEPHSPSPTWPGFLTFLRSKKPQIASMLSESSSVEIADKDVVVHFAPSSMSLSLLDDPDRLISMRALLSEFFGRPLNIRYISDPQTSDGISSSKEGNIIEEALSIFGPETTKVS